jgi:hypothetical protein
VLSYFQHFSVGLVDMMNNDDNTGPNENLITRRTFVAATGAAAAAALLPGNAQAQEVELDLNIVPRFALPAGNVAGYAGLPTLNPDNNFLYWTVNAPGKGMPNAEIIIAGQPGALPKRDDYPFIEGRGITQAHLQKPQDANEPSFMMIGHQKVAGVAPGSVILPFRIKAKQAIQLNNMPGSVIVTELDGVKDGAANPAVKAFTNPRDFEQTVMIVVPPNEHGFGAQLRTPVKLASDFGELVEGLAKYKNARVGRNIVEMKKELHADLKKRIWNMFADMSNDAGVEKTPEELKVIFDRMMAPDPSRNPKERMDNKEKLLGAMYESLSKRRAALKANGRDDFAYHDDELKFMFQKGKGMARSFLADFIESVEYAQSQAAAPQPAR